MSENREHSDKMLHIITLTGRKFGPRGYGFGGGELEKYRKCLNQSSENQNAKSVIHTKRRAEVAQVSLIICIIKYWNDA